ncbi:PREDICTED: uncharacterized oxidoreductase MexAM1_META1p0182-like [Papilio polytes]|uniref:uncharacterized oxidoreductase MexAM1_META1p0182-like n=1 Tax=Papilio polytes TaxID=76194 RepID=UPI000676902C|nr:PREDICTED: uncharacterized oxidoreductase MexAM1_META1p0182-like [Papilio polytes]
MSFEGKLVIVTGSSSGIGASIALRFAKEGAQVILVGRNEKKLQDVYEQCATFGKKPLIVKIDVTKDDEAKTLIKQTIDRFGQLDVLVNNAGVGGNFDILSEDFMENYDRIVRLNLRAVVFITHLALPYLIESKGNIVNISSIGAKINLGTHGAIPYCTAKAGVSHFSRCTAVKLAPYGVRVNIVSPGPVKTDILNNSGVGNYSWDVIGDTTLLKRVSKPEEIADVVLFLAGNKAKGITGSDFVVDNGTILKS